MALTQTPMSESVSTLMVALAYWDCVRMPRLYTAPDCVLVDDARATPEVNLRLPLKPLNHAVDEERSSLTGNDGLSWSSWLAFTLKSPWYLSWRDETLTCPSRNSKLFFWTLRFHQSQRLVDVTGDIEDTSASTSESLRARVHAFGSSYVADGARPPAPSAHSFIV